MYYALQNARIRYLKCSTLEIQKNLTVHLSSHIVLSKIILTTAYVLIGECAWLDGGRGEEGRGGEGGGGWRPTLLRRGLLGRR